MYRVAHRLVVSPEPLKCRPASGHLNRADEAGVGCHHMRELGFQPLDVLPVACGLVLQTAGAPTSCDDFAYSLLLCLGRSDERASSLIARER